MAVPRRAMRDGTYKDGLAAPRSTIDSTYKEGLFEENDSGLGSMPRDLNSIDLVTLQDSEDTKAASDHTHLSSQQCPEKTQVGHLLSLTSGLLHMSLDADRSNTSKPDSRRMTILERQASSFDNDSGNFSITTASMAAVDADDNIMPSSQSHWSEQEQRREGCEDYTSRTPELSRGVEQEGRTLYVTAEQRVGLFQGDADGDNWLHLSIIHGHVDLALTLLALAPDYMWLSYSNHLRQTPLHLAVLTGQDLLVRRLVCAGAIVDAQDMRGDTPLHVACRLGHIQTVRNLLTPVRFREKHSNMCQRLPQDLAVQNSEGQTPLHVAVMAGHENIVELLLKTGADPNIGDAKSGRTALHMAAERGRVRLVQLLAGCCEVDLFRRNYAGCTAAQLALGRNLECIAHFLQTDSDQASDSESDMTMVGSDSDDDWFDEVME